VWPQPAAAQGVTGTVSGTVKDAQGAVIPGATITLISESRGTTIATVISNGSGDFVVPNVTADTYTIQISMPSFKTLKRTGLMVSAGGTRHARDRDDRRRPACGRGDGQGRHADHSGSERREVVHDHHRIGGEPAVCPGADTMRCSA
jgi:hypothetical protein